MLTVGRDGTAQFFNNILHGLDTTSIIRMNVPIQEVVIGLVQTFFLGWLVGASVAGIYNFGITKIAK